jgi:NADPH:quinone reductase-like Zn-dependent oxidoreductase
MTSTAAVVARGLTKAFGDVHALNGLDLTVPVQRPAVGDHDVLIWVRATSVNIPDWSTVTGLPYLTRLKSGLRRPSTPVRGSDVAGVVEAVGRNVTDLQPGDEVFGSLWDNTITQAGTFAEYSVAPASRLIKKPASLTFQEAAASVMSGLTALIALREVGRVGPGTRVLINGASGGVGTLAVQIAKAIGADVTGVCSTRNLELVGPSAPITSSTTPRRTSPAASSATTSSSTT